ncbi:hypothetical protein ACHAW6_000600 [Cyclotella cf. meneghiniana]
MMLHIMAVGTVAVIVEHDMKYHPLFCVCSPILPLGVS